MYTKFVIICIDLNVYIYNNILRIQYLPSGNHRRAGNHHLPPSGSLSQEANGPNFATESTVTFIWRSVGCRENGYFKGNIMGTSWGNHRTEWN